MGKIFRCRVNRIIPNCQSVGLKTSDFIPEQWKTLGEAKGDLNGDNIEDAAMAVQGTYSKFVDKEEKFDTNPRMLIVLFGSKVGYRLAEKSNSIIAIPDSPSMTEPFDSLAIKNGVLHIRQGIFMSAGGWTTSNHLYKFRYQNSEFVLIGAGYAIHPTKYRGN